MAPLTRRGACGRKITAWRVSKQSSAAFSEDQQRHITPRSPLWRQISSNNRDGRGESGEGGNDVSTSMQLLRNRSTRQLWDTNCVDQSWIGSQPANNILMLIPRMRNWVNTYYPGTRTGIGSRFPSIATMVKIWPGRARLRISPALPFRT